MGNTRGHRYSLPERYFGRIACRSSAHRPHERISSQRPLVPNIDSEIEEWPRNVGLEKRQRAKYREINSGNQPKENTAT